MESLLMNPNRLPANMRLQMREFIRFAVKLRTMIVTHGFIARKTFEKRTMKDTVIMLSHQLTNVLHENRELIEA